ncbi:MarR family transcriptional regulator [Sulfitobacter sp. LCG007]
MPDRSDFDPRQFLPYLLNQAAEACSLEFQQVYKDRYGMLRTEWRVLFHLGIHGRMTASAIAQAATMHKTKISRAVQRLSDRHFIDRLPDESDRRIEHLELTSRGRAAYQELRGVAARYDDSLAERLSAEENRMLRRVLLKLMRSDGSA